MTGYGHDEIRPVCREEFADCGMSRDFAEQTLHLMLEKSDDYIVYLMLDAQDRVPGYQNSPLTSERVQKSITPGADPNSDTLAEDADDDDD